MSLASVSQPLQGSGLYTTKRAQSTNFSSSQRLMFEEPEGEPEGTSHKEHQEAKEVMDNNENIDNIKLPAIATTASPAQQSRQASIKKGVGHSIISDRDKASQDHFRAEIRHSQPVSSAIQHQGVASSFQQKKGLIRHSVAVDGSDKAAPPPPSHKSPPRARSASPRSAPSAAASTTSNDKSTKSLMPSLPPKQN